MLLEQLKPKEAIAEIAKAYKGVTKALSAKLKKNAEMTRQDCDFYNTIEPDVKVCVQHEKDFLSVSLALQQRKGVWHDFGNVGDDDRVKEFKKKFGKLSSARLDKNGPFLGNDPVEVAKELAAKLS